MRFLAVFMTLFGALLALAACGGRDRGIPPAAVATPPANPAEAPAPTPEDTLVLQLSSGGPVRIQLRPDKAPKHVERIKTLTRQGFYNGLTFHRVIEGFMAQGGDPLGTGEGGSTLPDLESEFNDLPHVRGVTSMARADDPNSANSQFFVMLMPTLRLDNRYTAFGRVLEGMQYVDALPRGEPPAEPGRIVRAWIEADGPNAPLQPAPLLGPAETPAVAEPAGQ